MHEPTPAPSQPFSWRAVNFDLLFLTALVLAVHLPYALARVIPVHDAIQPLQILHYFYSGLHFNHAVPNWIPYGSFGTPGDVWNIVCLTPSAYLAAGVGWVLGVQDVLPLFYAALLLDQVILVLGLYVLGRLCYANRWAVLMVCSGATACTLWNRQTWWDFRIYYALPWVFSFLVLFFRRGRGHYLWLAGAAAVLGLVGNLPYFGPLYVFLLTIFCLAMSWKRWRIWLNAARVERANLLALALFIILAGVYVLCMSRAMSHLLTQSEGRDAQSNTVTLQEYLTCGGYPENLGVLRQMVTGFPVHGTWNGFDDQTVYIGLIPLLLFGWAVCRVRRREFLALLAVIGSLLLLMARGKFAVLSYYFPSMPLFRYLSMLWSLTRILILIAAGWGLADLLQSGTRRHWIIGALVMLVLADFMAGLGVVGNAVTQQSPYPPAPSAIKPEGGLGWSGPFGEATSTWQHLLGWRLAAYVTALGVILVIDAQRRRQGSTPAAVAASASPQAGLRLPAAWVGGALLAAYLVDVLLFAAAAWATMPSPALVRDWTDDTMQVAPLPYIPQRATVLDLDHPPPPAADPRPTKAIQLMGSLLRPTPPQRSFPNYTCYAFARVDALYFNRVLEPNRMEWADPVWKVWAGLMQQRRDPQQPPDPRLGPLDRELGATAPKMRLVSQAVYVADERQAITHMVESPDADQTVVLPAQDAATWIQPGTVVGGKADPATLGTVNVTHFTPDEVQVEAQVNGLRPIWLVYADSYHPDWQVFVDGQPATVLRANQGFKAVELSQGAHQVRWAFRPGAGWLTAQTLLPPIGIVAALLVLLAYLFLLFRGPALPWGWVRKDT